MFKSLFTFLSAALLAVTVYGGEIPVRLDEPVAGYDYPVLKESPSPRDDVTWSNLPEAPANFGRAASAVLGDYFYVFGSRYYNLGLAFNLSSEQWEQGAPPPLFYHNWCAVATREAIYTFCGSDSMLARHNEVLRFTPTGGGPAGTWSLMEPYPQILTGVAAAWDGGNYIYAAGGGAPTAVADAYRYDIANNTWTQIAGMPSADWFHGAVYVRDKLYCMKNNYNYEYDPIANAWTTKASIPIEITFALFHLTNNDDYVISAGGGGHGSWPATNAVQLYDPVTDAWIQETVLPGTFGYACVQFVGDGTVISAGGVVNMAYTGITLKGTNFPGSGGPGANLQVHLNPHNPPVQIPPAGGSFSFDASVENRGAVPLIFDAWTEVILPNGVVYGPLMLRTGNPIPAGATALRILQQWVPAAAPPGVYTFYGNVGMYPDSVEDFDSFTFAKLSGEGSSSHNQGWAVYGWFDDAEASPFQYSSFSIHNSYPNPFNASTVISFELRVSSQVKLAVYDIAGREVAVLAEGSYPAGIHQAEWDAGDMASGVYFAMLEAGGMKQVRKLLLVK